jgi:acetyl esterase/lipase
MKRIAIIALVLYLTGISTSAQTSDCREQTNIPYYNDTVRKRDAYIAERCVLDFYCPAQTKGFATVVWFHGGGLTGGSKHIPAELKQQGFAVAAVNYRLYPQAKCPSYIEDAAAAVAWIFKHVEEYGGNPDAVFVAGHSAGAYLTFMLGMDKRWLAAHGIDANRIAGLIPLSGHAVTHMTIRRERDIPDTQAVIDEYAPLFHVRRDAPPMLLMTGDRELEMLGRYEENAYLLRMLKTVGHTDVTLYEFDGYGHDMLLPAWQLLIQFVKKHLPK